MGLIKVILVQSLTISWKEDLSVKTIYTKQKEHSLYLKNLSETPEIVLIFPVTRNSMKSSEKWKQVLKFIEESEISILVVIDKTEKGSASSYFMNHFEILGKQLFVLPRSIEDTLFDTLGEIILDKNMWILQLHDDDHWRGKVAVPEDAREKAVYFSDFYLNSETKGSIRIEDFSMPNRIVFSLIPSFVWNQFSRLVRDQKYHVAGSFDYVLNNMAQLVCEFEYKPGFLYYWKDDNWNTPNHAVAHLTTLTRNDGWENWSSPEISIYNRTIDSLASLNYIKECLSPLQVKLEIETKIKGFVPSLRKRIKYNVYILGLSVILKFYKLVFTAVGAFGQRSFKLEKQLIFYQFIKQSWKIDSIDDLIKSIDYIEFLGGFKRLQDRFQFWKQALSDLKGAS
jgi:hypothetical protein